MGILEHSVVRVMHSDTYNTTGGYIGALHGQSNAVESNEEEDGVVKPALSHQVMTGLSQAVVGVEQIQGIFLPGLEATSRLWEPGTAAVLQQ